MISPSSKDVENPCSTVRDPVPNPSLVLPFPPPSHTVTYRLARAAKGPLLSHQIAKIQLSHGDKAQLKLWKVVLPPISCLPVHLSRAQPTMDQGL